MVQLGDQLLISHRKDDRLDREKKVQEHQSRQNVRRPHVRHLCSKVTWPTHKSMASRMNGKGVLTTITSDRLMDEALEKFTARVVLLRS